MIHGDYSEMEKFRKYFDKGAFERELELSKLYGKREEKQEPDKDENSAADNEPDNIEAKLEEELAERQAIPDSVKTKPKKAATIKNMLKNVSEIFRKALGE